MSTAERTYMPSSNMLRTSQCLLVLFTVGICSRGYGYYNQTLKASPQVWMDVVHGTASAPEQYRIGIVMTAYGMSQLLHITLSQAFGVLDLMSALLAVLLLYALLVRSRVFLLATPAIQWFGSAVFVALTFYLVDWINWYQKVTTMPTACLVALMLWLWTPRADRPASGVRQLGMAAAFLALVVMQSLVRADVAFIVSAGLFVAAAMRWSPRLTLPRGATLALTAMTALVAVAVQLYLMKIAYPHASYGEVPVWMLVHDWTRVTEWASALIFLAPFLWTLAEARRRGSLLHSEGPEAAFLLAGVGYAVIWLVMGRLDEVRIFLPMALAAAPFSVQLAMQRLQDQVST